jgi:membrane protein involved in colicin uptake
MPLRDEGRRASVLVSIVVHALIIGLLIFPFFLPSSVIARMEQGAGGAGPAGGGGGGRRGTGGTVETLRYVRLAPDPVPTPTTLPVTRPALPVPKPEPVKPKPVETPPPPAPEQQSAAPAAQTTVASATPGTGGGSGTDGSAGAGPGSGGGVGSGVGTGRGSANGPGTGGGNQPDYPPQVLNLTLPPLPAPKSVRGWTMRANFDVDSTGRVLDFKVNDSPDRGFNQQLASILRTYKFRPGTRPDGTPVRKIAQLSFDF